MREFVMGVWIQWAFAATTTTAADNARRVIDFEKKIGLFFEERLQEALEWDWFL